jgi:hypothetical protein
VPRILFLLRAWLRKHRGLVVVTLAALAVRLWWNLSVHRPTAFAYSDMGGYLDRGNVMFDRPLLKVSGPWVYPYLPALARWLFSRVEIKADWLGLYPYGTHYFIFAVRRLFGRTNDAALGAAFAVLGTLAVAYAYATAERFLTRPWARRLAGVVLVVYYPWISMGGYLLSEMPFTFCVAGTAFYGLRLADEGRRRDAWLLGLFLGIGATVRPQILVAAVFLGLHFVFRRRAWRHFRPGLAVRAAAPLALILALSSARLYYHTDKLGLISTNGPLNFVFGRCHNVALHAHTPSSRGFFGPPALGALLEHEKDLAKRRRGKPLFRLDPVFADQLLIHATMMDADANNRLAAACVTVAGLARELRFAATHVVLLWGYNIPWPDQGQKARWRIPMEVSSALHNALVLGPAAVALVLAFRRRRARSMLLALHVFSVVLTAMLYFGDTRYRTPYDGILVVLAMQTYVELWALQRRARDRIREVRFRRSSQRGATFPSRSSAHSS